MYEKKQPLTLRLEAPLLCLCLSLSKGFGVRNRLIGPRDVIIIPSPLPEHKNATSHSGPGDRRVMRRNSDRRTDEVRTCLHVGILRRRRLGAVELGRRSGASAGPGARHRDMNAYNRIEYSRVQYSLLLSSIRAPSVLR